MSPRVTWIGVVVGLLLLSVVTQLVGVFLAVSDPSFAVEPDYERKAARWDDHVEQQRENQRLGWTLQVRCEPTGDRGKVEVSVNLLDSFARPIEDAEVELEVFHNARASRILRGTLEHVRKDRYAATFDMRRTGIWEFRIAARRAGDLFTYTEKRNVALK